MTFKKAQHKDRAGEDLKYCDQMRYLISRLETYQPDENEAKSLYLE